MRLSNPFISRIYEPEQGETKQVNQTLIFWIATFVLFAIATTPLDTALLPFAALLDWIYSSSEIASYLQSISGKFSTLDREEMLRLVTGSAIIPAKRIFFLLSVATLFYWPLKSLKRAPWLLLNQRARLWAASKCFALAALFVLPLGLKSLGDSYARMSLSPFDEPIGILYRRLVMPATANVLGLSGYVFYFFFSLILAFVFLSLLLAWLEKSEIKMNTLVLVSMVTCSFFIYAFEMPGYPDQLSMIFLLLIVSLPLSELGKLSLTVVALATHEAALLMLLPVALFTFSKREQRHFLVLILMYALLAFAGAAFDIQSLVDLHSNAELKKPWTYLVENPVLLIAGIFVAYKLFWIVGGVGAFKAWKSGERRLSWLILSALLFPFTILPFAVDTSRFAGFGFFGMLLAVKFLMERRLISSTTVTTFSVLNLLLPSFYVGLNSGVILQPGLYRLLWGWMF